MSHRPIIVKAADRAERKAKAVRALEKLANTVPIKLADRMNLRYNELIEMGYTLARAEDKVREEFTQMAKEVKAAHDLQQT